ncbi:hypothetical protein N7457_004206 [Penicillium paradoxum]|uniref:uncharacterized protein n=1 Tax=Penicillium paradoxum TaxID=176176 RepID=UPI0025487B3C|nr:uncharacterized protein N7457_004206 [Penicillium paradoxum]KAJ5782432.1 hypothetical protein N7457_004206 [Penicillium paradoxum]
MPMPTDSMLSQKRSQRDKASAHRSEVHSTQKASHSEMGPAELLSEEMDNAGNAVPDPNWPGEAQNSSDKEHSDLVDAMKAETADFE